MRFPRRNVPVHGHGVTPSMGSTGVILTGVTLQHNRRLDDLAGPGPARKNLVWILSPSTCTVFVATKYLYTKFRRCEHRQEVQSRVTPVDTPVETPVKALVRNVGAWTLSASASSISPPPAARETSDPNTQQTLHRRSSPSLEEASGAYAVGIEHPGVQAEQAAMRTRSGRVQQAGEDELSEEDVAPHVSANDD